MSEAQHAARLAKLIVSGGEQALQRVIRRISDQQPLAGFLNSKFEEINSLHDKGLITEEQMKNLFPSDQNSLEVKTFDYRLLILLLTTVCDLQQPRRGWKTLPLSRDNSLEANLARLITICGDCQSSEAIDDKTFEMYLVEIEQVLIALGVTNEEFETLKEAPVTNNELQMLRQWAREEESVEEKLKRTQDNVRAILSDQQEALQLLHSSSEKKVRNSSIEHQFITF